ncbi:eosinophil peroxidase isoform X2 [Microcaecilia unicolor]|uniref:Myeloperoxidase-like isoform X2 n=1 Tax=Microcaecilia unicolor TaxID=1415580 RepID=A0A6P7WUC1_9AMPH|nr:myeloperoxidase-like isoform X2 [Microcaecilia unicolor]
MRTISTLLGSMVILALIQTTRTSFYDGVEELETPFILSCAEEAKHLVDVAYKHTRQSLKAKMKQDTVSPSDVMSFFKQPVARSRTIIRAADYMGTTLQLLKEKMQHIYRRPFNVTDLLTPEQLESLSKFTGCVHQNQPPPFCTDSLYRTITGVCNNRKNPFLGSSNQAYGRWLPAEYEDGISLPKGWNERRTYSGFRLPLAREVSNQIARFTTNVTLDQRRALIFMQWGQWTDHDLDLAPETPAKTTFLQGVDCDHSCAKAPPCFPLKIPPNDPRIRNRNDCIPLFRSAPACTVGPVREQINVLTSFIDASQVYGSDDRLAFILRNHSNQLGMLAVNTRFTDRGLAFLPFDTMPEDFCFLTNRTSGIPCFLSGDPRTSEQPGLTAFHTMFLREHNRLATELKRLNPQWSGETIYQEARKILGGIAQKITYKDYLPLLLGSQAMSRFLPRYRQYNESVDPTVSNVFSLAYRFAHASIQPFIFRLDDRFQQQNGESPVLLHQTFFSSWRIVREGGIDPLLRGLMANRAKMNTQKQILTDELRERLFKLFKRIGLDLGAINMQRGRDHGLPGYNAWRRFCGLSQPRNLDELANVLQNRDLARKFINLYGTPNNIDIWIGGVAEPFASDARIGPLLSCLIGKQFQDVRDGDRFYYENPGVFTRNQIQALERVTLSHIICKNTRITQVPRNVFLGNSFPQDFVNCNQIPALDLTAWRNRTENSRDNMDLL